MVSVVLCFVGTGCTVVFIRSTYYDSASIISLKEEGNCTDYSVDSNLLFPLSPLPFFLFPFPWMNE